MVCDYDLSLLRRSLGSEIEAAAHEGTLASMAQVHIAHASRSQTIWNMSRIILKQSSFGIFDKIIHLGHVAFTILCKQLDTPVGFLKPPSADIVGTAEKN